MTTLDYISKEGKETFILSRMYGVEVAVCVGMLKGGLLLVFVDLGGGSRLLFWLRTFENDICNGCQVISTGWELFSQQQIKE